MEVYVLFLNCVICHSMKKEAAIMAKEIEKRQKEYIEKQKMKHKLEDKCKCLLINYCDIYCKVLNNVLKK